MDIAKTLTAIRSNKIHLDRLDHDQLGAIVLHVVGLRLESLRAEFGDDVDVGDVNDAGTEFGHINDPATVFRIADWHMWAGAAEAARFITSYPCCDVVAVSR